MERAISAEESLPNEEGAKELSGAEREEYFAEGIDSQRRLQLNAREMNRFAIVCM